MTQNGQTATADETTPAGADAKIPHGHRILDHLLDGMEIIAPGAVQTHRWRAPAGADGRKPLPMWVGVARKR